MKIWLNSRSIGFAVVISTAVAISISLLAWWHVQREGALDVDDLNRRAHLLAYRMREPARAALTSDDAAALGSRVEGYRRFLGFAIFGRDEKLREAATSLAHITGRLESPVRRVLAGAAEASEIVRQDGVPVHLLAMPVHGPDNTLLGVVAVAHDMSFVDDRFTTRLTGYGIWIVFVTLTVALLVMGAMWVLYAQPMRELASFRDRQETFLNLL